MIKKVSGLFAIVLLSAIAVSAQTKVRAEAEAGARSPEEAKGTVTVKRSVRKNDPRILRVGPSTTYLKNGLSIDDVVGVLGEPMSSSERQDGKILLTTYLFERSEERVLVAEFENGLLVSSHTGTPEEVAQYKEAGQ